MSASLTLFSCEERALSRNWIPAAARIGVAVRLSCDSGVKPRLMAQRMLRILLLALLRFYKLAISPFLGDRCRFYPSCSDYARDAIQYHGAARGSYLALKRVCRCHPFSAGGVDPVPASSNFKR